MLLEDGKVPFQVPLRCPLLSRSSFNCSNGSEPSAFRRLGVLKHLCHLVAQLGSERMLSHAAQTSERDW